MIDDPHYLARGMVQRVLSSQGWDVPMTGVVPRFERTPGMIRHPGQTLGADTRAVLSEIAGVDDAELTELARAGLIPNH